MSVTNEHPRCSTMRRVPKKSVCGRPYGERRTTNSVSHHHPTFALQPLCLIVGAQRVNDGLELAVHNFGELMNGQPNAVVGDAVLGEVVGANFFAAVAATDHGLALF